MYRIFKLFLPLFLLIFPVILHASDYSLYLKGGHTSEEWNPSIKEGFSAYDAGDIKKASFALQRALNQGCQDALVYFKLGIFYETINNAQRAIEYYKKALQFASQYPNHKAMKGIHAQLGRIYFVSGKMSHAQPSLEIAVKQNQKDFQSHFLLGQLFRLKGDPMRAMVLFDYALEIGVPNNLKESVYSEVGKVSASLKQFEKSRSFWTKVLEINPKNKEALRFIEKLNQL
jgi:tetratricopeptide (TPR) repeat protein